MKVKLLKHAAIGPAVHKAGTVLDVPDAWAKTWAAMGVYEPVEEPAESGKPHKHGRK